MKKSYILGALAVVAASLTSCDDFLNDNRYPESIQTSNPTFWSNPSNVQGECNYFFELFSGYGNSSSLGEFYAPAVSDDKTSGTGDLNLAPWKNINVPTSSGNWSTPYTYIRRSNLIIEGVEGSSMSDTEKGNFIGIARLFRAYEYYMLVRCYGDVPLIKGVADPADRETLFMPRTPRNEVMDFVLEDLDYAIKNITTKNGKQVISQDLAKAMKSEICLYEGSYAKYHKADNTRANKFFTEVVNCTEPLVDAYPIGNDYQATYISFNKAALANNEIIFLKEYVKDVFMHCTVDYTSSSTPISGLTKDAFDAFLFIDGKPLALTSENTDDAGELLADGTLSIAKQLAVRDGRLAQITDDVVYYKGKEYKRPNSMGMTSVTGYGVKKFVNPEMDYAYTTTIWNYTCAPLFWGGYMALNLAEAKAELGSLSDADLNKTINKLFARANLPAQTVASLSDMKDPAKNMDVSSLIWEIRRCRRCELMFDKDIRYWDLVRWHQLELLDNTKHPNIGLGANIKNSDVPYASIGDYINAAGQGTRVYEERQYLFPVPSGQRDLYEGGTLTQNPGW